MKAAFYTEQGPARSVLRFGDQPMPQPGPGEVRVRLRSSGVNPSDWKSRNGGANRAMIAPLIIPHSDGAGDIDAVGPGVAESRIGERVWLWNGQWKRPFGTAAEYIALPAAQAVPMPEGLDYAAGACLGIPALTAMQAVRLAAAGPGDTILVSGGAGAVGHYAIQFAKARGARVLATISGEAKAAHARTAGADEVINYRTEDVGERVRALTEGRGADAVIEMDFAANARLLPRILRPHGAVIVYGTGAAEAVVPAVWLMQNSIAVRFFLVYELTPQDRADGLAELDRLLRAGTLIHEVSRRMPLDQIAAAHEAVERGEVIGNVVLDIA
jgi:NADPH2:quinone reductase